MARSFDAFKESHDALVKYLGYRYPQGILRRRGHGGGVSLAKVKADATLKSGKLSLYDQGKSAWAEKDISAASDDELKAAYAQIESDKKTMRYGMGDWLAFDSLRRQARRVGHQLPRPLQGFPRRSRRRLSWR